MPLGLWCKMGVSPRFKLARVWSWPLSHHLLQRLRIRKALSLLLLYPLMAWTMATWFRQSGIWCSVAGWMVSQFLEGTWCLYHYLWIWRPHNPSKFQELLTQWHSVLSWKTGILCNTSVITTNLTSTNLLLLFGVYLTNTKCIGADCDYIVSIFVINTKFLGWGLHKNMKWKTPIVLIIPKLSRTYVIRAM